MSDEPDTPAHGFRTNYMDEACSVTGLDQIVANAQEWLEPVDFDTLVGTGLSGSLVVPPVAMALGKHFVIVRKPKDGSHHNGPMVGWLGERWVFLDDFTSLGRTRTRVLTEIAKAALAVGHETEHVGDYYYQGHGSFTRPEEVSLDD